MTTPPPPDVPLLEPFPNGLLDPARKAEVIGWINTTAVPVRYRAHHLQRWAEYVGVTLTGADYRAIGRPWPRAGE